MSELGAPKRGRVRAVLVAMVSGLLLAALVVGCGSGGTLSAGDGGATTESRTIPDGPPVRVNGGSPAMLAWAADVSEGNLARLTEKCWKYPASYIADRYVYVDRTRLNAVLAAEASPGQVGTTWTSEAGEVIDNGGISEPYACPQVTLDGQEQFPDDLVALTAKRYILIKQGRPMNPAEVTATGQGQPLGCGPTPSRGPYDSPVDADPNALTVGKPVGRQSSWSRQWPVEAGAQVVFIESRVTQLCVRAVTSGGLPYADPGENCGSHTYQATGTQAGIFVTEGGMSCGEALALIDRYFTDPALVRQGNTNSAMFDGWTCASPTAVAARAAGYSTQCTNAAKGITIQLVPNR